MEVSPNISLSYKLCKHCGLIKPISEFHKNNNTKDGYRINCKKCRKKKRRPLRLKRVYGLNDNELDALFQKGKCAICGSIQNLCIDHNHKIEKGQKGYIRDILCTSCNAGIGLFKDDISLLKNAIKYLQKHNL